MNFGCVDLRISKKEHPLPDMAHRADFAPRNASQFPDMAHPKLKKSLVSGQNPAILLPNMRHQGVSLNTLFAAEKMPPIYCQQSLLRPCLVVLAALALAGCRDYDNRPGDRAALQRMCDPVRDVPVAIEAHKARHGKYPITIADLDMTLPNSSAAAAALNASGEFVYSSAGDAFSIYRKLNWDGGIVYSSIRPEWIYSLNEDKEFPIY